MTTIGNIKGDIRSLDSGSFGELRKKAFTTLHP